MAAVDAFKVRAVIEAGYDKNSLRRANSEIATSFNSLRTRMSRVASAARASQTIFMTTGAGIVAAFGAGAMAAASFEEQFVRVKKTLDIKGESAQIEKSFDNIGKKLRDLTKQSPVTTDAITEIASVGGQLGVAASDIVAFTNTIQKLTVATNLSAENASMAMSRLQEITGSTVSELDNLGSSLVALGNNFAAQESEIVNAAMQIATSTAQIQGEMNNAAVDALAFSTALRAIGQPSQAGATAIVRLMSELSEAMAQGGDSLKLFADVSRMSVPAFEELYSLDSSQAVAAFIKGLDDTSSVGQTNITVLQKLGLGQVRTQKAILALAKANETLYSALETANVAYRENIALTEEAERRYETLFSELAKGKNILKAEFIDFGLDKLDGAKKIVKDLNNILFITTRTALNLTDSFSRTIIPIFGIVAAFKSVRASVTAAATDMRMFATLSERATIAGKTMATAYNTGSKGAGRFTASNVLSYSTGEDGTEIDPMLARAMVPRSFMGNRLGLPFNTLGPSGTSTTKMGKFMQLNLKERLSNLGIGKSYSMRVLDTLAQPQLVEQIFGGKTPDSLLMSTDKQEDVQLSAAGRMKMAELRKKYLAGQMKKAEFENQKSGIMSDNTITRGVEKRYKDAAFSQDYFQRFSRETALGGVKTYMPTAMGQAQARGSLLRAQMRTAPRELAIKALKKIESPSNPFKTMANEIKSVYEPQIRDIMSRVTEGIQKATGAAKNFGNQFKFIFRGLREFAMLWINGFKDGIKEIATFFKNQFGFIFRGFRDFAKLWIDGFKDGITQLTAPIRKVIGQLREGMSFGMQQDKLFRMFDPSIPNRYNNAVKAIHPTVKKIRDTINQFFKGREGLVDRKTGKSIGDEAIPSLMNRLRARAGGVIDKVKAIRPPINTETVAVRDEDGNIRNIQKKTGGFLGAAQAKISSGIKKLESMQIKSQARINQRQKMYDDLAIFRQDMKNKGAVTYKQIIDNQIKALLKRNQAETGIDPAGLTKRQMSKFRGAALGGRMGAFEEHIAELRTRAETTKDLSFEELQLLDATDKARAGMGRFTNALKGMALAAGKVIFQLVAFQAVFAFVAKMGAKSRGIEEFAASLSTVSEKLREIQVESIKLSQLTASDGPLSSITDKATLEAAEKKIKDIGLQLEKAKRDAAQEIGTSFVNDIIIAGTGNEGSLLETLIKYEMKMFEKSRDQVTKEIGSSIGNVLINAIDPEILAANAGKLPSVDDVLNSVLFNGKEIGKDVNVPSDIFDGVSSSILIGLQDSIGKSVSGKDLIDMLGIDDINDPSVRMELLYDLNNWMSKFYKVDLVDNITGESLSGGPVKALNKVFDNVKKSLEAQGLEFEDSDIAKFTLDLVQAMSTAEGVIGMSIGGIGENFDKTLSENSIIGKQVKEFMKNRLKDFRDTGLVTEAEVKRAGNNYGKISSLYLDAYDRFSKQSELTSQKLQEELGITESAALQLAARLDQAFKEARKSLVALTAPLPEDAFEDMTALDVLMNTIKKDAQQTRFEQATSLLGDLGKPVLAAELSRVGSGGLGMAEEFLNNPALAAAQEMYLRSLGGADYVSEIVPDEAEGADAERLEEMGYVLGERSVEGILQGLNDRSEEVSEAFASILMKAFDGAVKLFIIRSPSQLMRRAIGQPLIDGVIVGIEDGELKLKDTFNNVLKRATNPKDITKNLNLEGNYKGTSINYSDLTNIVASNSEFAPNKFLAQGLIKSFGTEMMQNLDMFAEKLSKSYAKATTRMQEAFQVITNVTRAERAQTNQARNLVKTKQDYASVLRRESTLTDRLAKAKENLVKLEIEGMAGNITASERIGVLQREIDLSERKRRLNKEFTAREALDIQAQERKVSELGRMFNLGIVSGLELESEQDVLRDMKGEFKTDTEKELFLLEYAEAIDAKAEYEKEILETSPELVAARDTYIGLLDEQKLIQLDIQAGANSIAEAEEAVASGVLAVEAAYAEFKEKAPEYQEEIKALDNAFGGVNERVGTLIDTITNLSADGTFDFSGLKTQISDVVSDLSELLFAKELDEMMDMGGLSDFTNMYMSAVQAVSGGTPFEGASFGTLMNQGLLGMTSNPILMDLYKDLGGKGGREITDLSNIDKFSEYMINSGSVKKRLQRPEDLLSGDGYAGIFDTLINAMGVGTVRTDDGQLAFSIANAEAISKGLSKELMASGLLGMQDSAYKQLLNLFLEGEAALRTGPVVDEFFNDDNLDPSGFGTPKAKSNININLDSGNGGGGGGASDWLRGLIGGFAENLYSGYGINLPQGMMGLRAKGFKMGGRVPDMTHISPKKYAMGGRDNLMRRALVGEYGPEEVRFVPGSGFLVKPLTHGGRGNNTVVENLSVNVTGVPADPSQARKAAVEIRKALSRLDREGSTGGSVRRN